MTKRTILNICYLLSRKLKCDRNLFRKGRRSPTYMQILIQNFVHLTRIPESSLRKWSWSTIRDIIEKYFVHPLIWLKCRVSKILFMKNITFFLTMNYKGNAPVSRYSNRIEFVKLKKCFLYPTPIMVQNTFCAYVRNIQKVLKWIHLTHYSNSLKIIF